MYENDYSPIPEETQSTESEDIGQEEDPCYEDSGIATFMNQIYQMDISLMKSI